MSLTPEGAICLEHARRMLDEIEELGQRMRRTKGAPRGLLRVHATLGLGRRHVAPAASEFVRRYPRAEVRLMLAADPPPLDDDAFDVSSRLGAPPEARVVARLIARNRRVLVAAPPYLAQHGTPQAAADLARHDCIVIRQGDDAHGQWRLIARSGAARGAPRAIRVRGSLSSNDGEVALAWALEGRGILLRSEWDVAPHLARGAPVRVLPERHRPRPTSMRSTRRGIAGHLACAPSSNCW